MSKDIKVDFVAVLKKYISGDKDAAASLIEFFEPLRAMYLGMFSKKGIKGADIDDLSQEFYLLVLEVCSSYTGPWDDADTVYRKISGRIRKRLWQYFDEQIYFRYKHLSLQSFDFDFTHTNDDHTLSDLRASLDAKQYAPRTCEIVELYDAGYTQEEIAQMLGISQPAVFRHLRKARRLLQP